MRISVPPKLVDMFTTKSRYKIAYGGRGSGKSHTFSKMLAVRGMAESLRILCAREFQVSLKNSSFAEIVSAINSQPELEAFYECGVNYIRGKNGTEFIFSGLAVNPHSIKSLSNIDICFVEEAETVSERSWNLLIPTIRKEGSEIWISFNPERSDSPTNVRFLQNTPPDAIVVELNYMDNPWFPKELDEERKNDFRRNPDMYEHVWLGKCLSHTNSQIMAGKWLIEAFDETILGTPYFGADWGFAQDPTTLIKMFISNNILYIREEVYKSGVDIDHTPALFSKVSESNKYIIRADSVRPEIISYMNRHGYRVVGAKKGKGSVEAGITFMRSFECIKIHPNCKETIKEMSNYSYKVDRLTGDLLPDIVDDWNHCMDAIRYALEPIAKPPITNPTMSIAL